MCTRPLVVNFANGLLLQRSLDWLLSNGTAYAKGEIFTKERSGVEKSNGIDDDRRGGEVGDDEHGEGELDNVVPVLGCLVCLSRLMDDTVRSLISCLFVFF